jgi:hypothetical protein
VDVMGNGRVYLWDLVTGEDESAYLKPGRQIRHFIRVWVYTCKGERIRQNDAFFRVNNPEDKSLVMDLGLDEFEEIEMSDTFLFPIFNNIIPQEENGIHNFSIIPNPNTGTFQLETNFPPSNIAYLKITNLLGITVYEARNLSSSTIQLPSSAFGHHSVVIILKDGSVLSQNMIIQR